MAYLNEILIGLITTAIGSVLGTLVTNEKIKYFAIRMVEPFSSFRTSNLELRGTWKAIHTSPNRNNRIVQFIMLHQFGNVVVGRSQAKGSKVKISGKIVMGKFFEGSYYDRRGSNEYFGTFQVTFEKNESKKLTGKWIGYDKNTHSRVNSGDWEWEELEDIC